MPAHSNPAPDDADRFRGIVAHLPAALYTTDAAGRITYFNDAAADLWGRRPVIGEELWCGSWRLYWPDGSRMPHDECPMAITVKTGKPIRGAEAIAERPDGSRFPFTPFPTPIFDDAGSLTGAMNMLVEITGREQSDASRVRLGRRLARTGRTAAALSREFTIASLFDQAARMVHRQDSGMSPLKWAILRYLARSGKARDRIQIAGYLGVSTPGVARDVSFLLRHAHISVEASGGGETFSLTDHGRAALQLDPLRRLARAIARLGEGERTGLADGLEAVADELAGETSDTPK